MFTSAGYFAFGTQVFDFSIFKIAVSSCFLLLLGDINIYSSVLFSADAYLSGVYFVLFVIFTYFIMASVLIALLRGHYEHVTNNEYGKYNSRFKFILYAIKYYHREKSASAVKYKKKKNENNFFIQERIITQVEIEKPPALKDVEMKEIYVLDRFKKPNCFHAIQSLSNSKIKPIKKNKDEIITEYFSKISEMQEPVQDSKHFNIQKYNERVNKIHKNSMYIKNCKNALCIDYTKILSSVNSVYKKYSLFPIYSIHSFKEINLQNEIIRCYMRYTNVEGRLLIIQQCIDADEKILFELWCAMNYEEYLNEKIVNDLEYKSVEFHYLLISSEYNSKIAKYVNSEQILLWKMITLDKKIKLWALLSPLCKSRLWNSVPFMLENNQEDADAELILKEGRKLSLKMREMMESMKDENNMATVNKFKQLYVDTLPTDPHQKWPNAMACSRAFLWSLSSPYSIESIVVENRLLYESDALKLIQLLTEEPANSIYAQDLLFENDIQWMLHIRDEYFKVYYGTLDVIKALRNESEDRVNNLQLNLGMICIKNERMKAQENKDITKV